jgi:predicted HicB family RNase H-like nuclease
MPKLTTKKTKKIAAARLELRISGELHREVSEYGELHLENISEIIVNAIKQTIGFQNISKVRDIPLSDRADSSDSRKQFRLSLRIHPTLKTALNSYVEAQGCTLSQAVIFSLQSYIKERQQ